MIAGRCTSLLAPYLAQARHLPVDERAPEAMDDDLGNELAMEEEAEEALATRVEEQREQFVVAAEEAASDPSQLLDLDFIEQH